MGCFLGIAETSSITLQSFLAVLALPLVFALLGIVKARCWQATAGLK